ncbi:MAG: cytochrome c biogenesis heme-transporting ATPase CcmA [Hydrogenophilales bacterium]|nr:cytochrome c biogenesis heme-transporting ATPase CcmA [Hydrogenophilales bacterium]
MLEAAHLTCQRGERTLFTNLSFTLGAGELLQVAGPNGSGKTSLLKLLCGLSHSVAGEIRWQGKPAHGEDFRRQLFYLGHQHAVKEELSALENLHISTDLAGEPLTDEEALDALDRMGLAGREHLPAKVLSQGQKRRVALARLLVSKAPLWILDEPLTALDVGAVDLIQSRLAEHLAHQGLVVLTTHQALHVPGVTPRRIELE